ASAPAWESEAVEAAGLGTWAFEVASGKVTLSEAGRGHFRSGSPTLPVRALAERVHPEDRQRFRELFECGLPVGLEVDADFRVIAADGEVRTIEVSGRLARGENGSAARAIGTTRDVTDKQRAREQLDALAHGDRVNELSQMAAGLAHELKQPLAAAQNYLSA